MNSTNTQPLVKNISDSIKQELDVDKFLETLTVESSIDHLKQFAISGWFLLKVGGAVIFLLTVQVYKLGQQTKVYFQPTFNSLTNKIYNYCKPINYPIAQFVTGLLSPKQTTSLTDSNDNPLTIQLAITNQTPHSMDSQEPPLSHTNN